ncbi:MAG: hypothetical protein KGK10_06985 [Rhodospirillales bacterium]|nr:hypothetical protein [Rhodospirillales bacterium]
MADGVRLPRIVSGWVDTARLPVSSIPVRIEILRNGVVIGSGPVDRDRPDISADPARPAGFQLTCSDELDDSDLALARIAVIARGVDGATGELPLYGRVRAEALDRLLARLGRPIGETEAHLRSALAAGDPLDATMAGELEAIAASAGAIAPDRSMREVMMAFESLGQDCALGSAQRHFGAEPLGLLRFSGIGLDAVRTALADRLRGVGDPAFTRMEPDDRGEFFTRDIRYHMQAHTFLFAANEERAPLFARQCRKLQYLARNLLDVLHEGSKIMVIHGLPDDLPDAGLRALLAVLRGYGDCPLLYVRAARPGLEAGEVVRGEGLFIGHVLVEDDARRPSSHEIFESWGRMCRRVHTLVHGALPVGVP